MSRIYYLIFGIVILSGCTRNNVVNKQEYKKLFDKYQVHGCFAAYDNIYDEFTIYNIKRYRDSSYSPASTFKIINSLIGIETGKIIDNETVKWDGVKREIEIWNKDYQFQDAFRNSVVWYFQKAARDIGIDTMQRFLNSLQYGSKKIIGPVDSFWLNNTVVVKPDEQLGLVKKLYFNQLSKFFSNRTMDKVKEAMLMEKTDKYALSYKTGLTKGTNGLPLSWVVGWIETGSEGKKQVNFFVLNTEGNISMDAMKEARMSLLKDLLKEEKLIQN
jgi:beta-lactamase class D